MYSSPQFHNTQPEVICPSMDGYISRIFLFLSFFSGAVSIQKGEENEVEKKNIYNRIDPFYDMRL